MKRLAGVAMLYLLISCQVLGVSFAQQTSTSTVTETETNLEKEAEKLPVTKMALALFYIKLYFYKEVDIDKCLEQILQDGISGCTDQYSRFTDEKGVESEDKDNEGYYEGIGIKYEIAKGTTTITFVYPNSPAGRLGMKAGDVIVAISPTGVETDLISVYGLDWDGVANLLDGKNSNKLIVSLKRNGKSKIFRIEKGVVKEDSVFFTKISPSIGYVKLTGFIETSEEDFELVVSSLTQSGTKVAIIDLRNNPGGLLESAVNIVGLFQPNNDPVVYTKHRDKEFVSIKSSSKKNGIFKNLKVVVLVNENTASAAELFSGWLKEEHGAQIIGHSTYGKDLVQSLFGFPDGTRLHLTTDQYYIGSKKVNIGKVGVQPTIKVEAKSNPKSRIDPQLQKAVEIAEKIVSSLN